MIGGETYSSKGELGPHISRGSSGGKSPNRKKMSKKNIEEADPVPQNLDLEDGDGGEGLGVRWFKRVQTGSCIMEK